MTSNNCKIFRESILNKYCTKELFRYVVITAITTKHKIIKALFIYILVKDTIGLEDKLDKTNNKLPITSEVKAIPREVYSE